MNKGEVIIYRSADGLAELSVQLEGETVWLSLNQMAELFDRDKSTISRHVKNIFAEGELDPNSVVAKYATTASDGKQYLVEYYNLDVIISVGYRVKSLRGTHFRIWAMKVLKEYIIKGFALNDDRLKNLGGGNYWKELLDRIRDTDVEEQIFSPEFVAQLEGIKLPATKLEVLVKMLRKAIKEYKSTNKIAAEKYEELLKETLDKYHERRSALSAEEASQTQATAVSEIMEEATKQALRLLEQLCKDRESFRHLGLTFEEKAFYDILMHLRDKYNFEYGEDKEENGFIFNDKCKILAKKIKELIDIQSSFTDWLNNSNIRADLNNKIFICLHQNGYPPQYNDEVIDQVMEQVEHFKEYGGE